MLWGLQASSGQGLRGTSLPDTFEFLERVGWGRVHAWQEKGQPGPEAPPWLGPTWLPQACPENNWKRPTLRKGRRAWSGLFRRQVLCEHL